MKEGGEAIAISKAVSNWDAEQEFSAPSYLYLGCIEVCLAIGVVPGVRAVPRAPKRAPEPIGGSSADFLFYFYGLIVCQEIREVLGVGNNLQVIWFLEFLVNNREVIPYHQTNSDKLDTVGSRTYAFYTLAQEPRRSILINTRLHF